MFLFLFIISLIPPNFCQLALASSSFISDSLSLSSTRKVTAQSKGLNVRDTRSRTLFTKFSDLGPPLESNNNSNMESQIAAIFKEFAYGSSTDSSTSSFTTTTTTTVKPTTSQVLTTPNYYLRMLTESNVFIGKQRNVHSEFKTSTHKPLYISAEKFTSTNDYRSVHDSTVYTYSINTQKKNSSSRTNKDKAKSVGDKYSSFDLDEENVNEVQVRVTSVLKKKGYNAIIQEIGIAWGFHVYVTGVLFGTVAITCLLSLSRLSTCSQLLPRGYFITLHLMLFLASFLRCLLFLHDPYGAYNRLPSVLTSLLFNSVDPFLTTAYSLVLLVLLRATRIRLVPLNMQSPLVLAIICGIHIGGSVVIDVSTGVLEDKNVITTLNITTQVITTVWGVILCLGYLISFSGIEKAAYRQHTDLARLTMNRKVLDDKTLKSKSAKPTLIYAARLFLICTLLHGVLIAFIIINLVASKVPISPTFPEAWAWWTQASLERIVEIVMCILLLATALVLTQSKTRITTKENEEKIFSIFSNCGRGNKSIKNIDVYPVASEKFNILENGTLRHNSLGGTINLSKNGWHHGDLQKANDYMMKNQIVVNSIDNEFKKALQLDYAQNSSIIFNPRQIVHNNSTLRPGHLYPENCKRFGNSGQEFSDKRNNYPYLNNFGRPLSGNNYYCSQRSAVQTNEVPNIVRCSTVHDNHCDSVNLCSTTSTSPIPYSKSEHEYEVAPYYTHSNSSNSSHVYTKPYSYCPSSNVHIVNLQECATHNVKPYSKNYETEPKSEMSVCSSSQSEIQVDYLTDVSSNDGLGNTLSRSLTLPLHSHHCPASVLKENMDNPMDSTPDSAVGLDYSSQVEADNLSPDNMKINSIINGNIPPRLLNLNSSTLNDAIRNQSVLLGKFVPYGCQEVDYSPLSLEETLSTPSSDYTTIKKSTSIGDLTDTQIPSEKQNTNVNSFNNELVNVINKMSLKPEPITSI